MIRSLFTRPEEPRIRGVHLYFSAETVIVAALHQNPDGIYFEQPTPTVIPARATREELGTAFRRAFEGFSVQNRDLRNAKAADWPAFRASGARSAKEFRNAFMAVQCYGLHSSNAVVRAATRHPAHEDIELSVSFNPRLEPEAVGGKLLQLVRAASAA